MNNITINEIKPLSLARKITIICNKIYDIITDIPSKYHLESIKMNEEPCIHCTSFELCENINEKIRLVRLREFMNGNTSLEPTNDTEAVLKIVSAGPNYKLPNPEDTSIGEEVYQKHVHMYPRRAVDYGFTIKNYMLYEVPELFLQMKVPDHSSVNVLHKTVRLDLLNSFPDKRYLLAVIFEAIKLHEKIYKSCKLKLALQYFDIEDIVRYLKEFPEDYIYLPTNILHEPEIICKLISDCFIKTKDSKQTAEIINKKYKYKIPKKTLETLSSLE